MNSPRILEQVNGALETLRGSNPRLVIWALAIAFTLASIALASITEGRLTRLLPLGVAAFVAIVLTVDIARGGFQD